jgi:hypothetical protein
MAKFLTSGDLRFLAAVTSSDESVAKLESIVDLTAHVIQAAEAAGIEADLRAIDVLEDPEVPVDDDQLDDIRADLRSQLGSIGRGEYPTEETTLDE